jgi:Ti-type conjugative transfer relaxase TraA
MANFHLHAKMIGKSTHNTVGAIAYRSGTMLVDEKTGEVVNYRNKSVEHVELILPENTPVWAQELRNEISENREEGLQNLINIMEKAEKRKDAQVWREVEFSLPRELTGEQNLKLAQEFAQDYIAKRGMPVLINAHFDVDTETGERKPHIHATISTRPFQEEGLGFKDTAWNDRKLVQNLREELCNVINFHLKLHGHEARVDHRSYVERGIDLEPQPKMGKNVLQMERRAQDISDAPRSGFDSPVTEKGKSWKNTRLKNVYQIVSRPEIIFDILNDRQSTFEWADVKGVLFRHIDDKDLAENLESKLRTSSELIVLNSEKSVFTSKAYARQEEKLSHVAEILSRRGGFSVSKEAFEKELEESNRHLMEKHGSGFSKDQKEALRHLCSEDSLSCLVGYAGSGKTTVLGTAQKAWEASGYRVQGLAPTGRASKALSQAGLPSATLHSFLKAFNEGRSHYSKETILVLDEGGMVPVSRMKEFLTATESLGVKAVIVGDGHQLQPIEAGAAFRKVTAIAGEATLETVVRQKEEWQREATQSFGKGDARSGVRSYVEQGCVTLHESKIPDLAKIEKGLVSSDTFKSTEARHDLANLFVTACHLQGQIYNEMEREISYLTGAVSKDLLKSHESYDRYEYWGYLKTASQHLWNKLQLGEMKSGGIDLRISARQEMLNVWKHSVDSGKDTLMMASTRKDVAHLNQSVRSFLKESGAITGREFVHTISRRDADDFGRQVKEMGQRSFAVGDQIIFLENDKGLGVENGSRGCITKIDQNKIQATLIGEGGRKEEQRIVSFSTNLYNAIDYGWATTIHKNQGSTCDKALYLANPYDNRNLSYVALTRHREEVRIFGAKEEFGDLNGVIRSLSRSNDKLLASDYLKEGQDLTALYQKETDFLSGIFTKLENQWNAWKVVSKEAIQDLKNKLLNIDSKREKGQKYFLKGEGERASEVLHSLNRKQSNLSERLVLKAPAFKEVNPSRHENLQSLTEPSRERIDFKVLESELSQRASSVAQSLLGDPNKRLSSKSELRYGSKGSFCVTVSGRNSGRWFDFEKGEGGGLFQLIQNTKGGSFKDSLDLANDFVGGRASVLNLQPRQTQKPTLQSEDKERERKIEKSQYSYKKSEPLDDLGKQYLASRGITISPGLDLRMGKTKDPETGKHYPALIGFARDSHGKITGGQRILLDSNTGKKADLNVSKRSFGVIKGSFVTLQGDDSKTGKTFIAEGIETALSLKQAGLEGKIVASLGVHNFKNYVPEKSEKTLIICGDNDGRDTPSFKIVLESIKKFEAQNKEASGILPEYKGEDFNDVLQKSGACGIRNVFQKAGVSFSISSHIEQSAAATQGAQKEKAPSHQEIESKTVEPRDWYKEIKGMRRTLTFEKEIKSLLEKAEDPASKESSLNQIKEALTVSSQESHLSHHVMDLYRNAVIWDRLNDHGIGLKKFVNDAAQNKGGISERLTQDLQDLGSKAQSHEISKQMLSQLNVVSGYDKSSKEHFDRSAKELCIVLKSVQEREDKETILGDLKSRHPKTFEQLEEISKTNDSLKQEVRDSLGIEKTQKTSKGFEMEL